MKLDLFKQHLSEKRAVKVIAGISNFDLENIRKVVTAAQNAGASAVDISARKEVLDMVQTMTDLPIFVSSIVPEELAWAVANGADAIELGNFDVFYKDGFTISSMEIIDLVKKTYNLIGHKDIFFSVTIPGMFTVDEQITLARELELLEVDLIQTEGYFKNNNKFEGVRGLLANAELTLANTIELSRNTDLPIMTASGVNTTTAALAFAAGASAIGVGSCVNRLDSTLAMTAVVSSLVETAQRNMQKTLVNA